MMRIPFLFCLAFIVMQSCSSSSNSESQDPEWQAAEQLREGMITIHDEVMPLMGKMNKVSRGLEKQLKNIEDETVKANAAAAIDMLEKGHEGMMDWMNKNGPHFRSLKKLKGTMNREEVIAYLKKETEEMKAIDVMSREGIEKGQAILDQLSK